MDGRVHRFRPAQGFRKDCDDEAQDSRKVHGLECESIVPAVRGLSMAAVLLAMLAASLNR